MSLNHPGLVLGYHGTNQTVAEKLISGKGGEHLVPSEQNYDWLGSGIYFWENSSRRAMQWAFELHPESPAVIGAVIQLGDCLDLLDQSHIDLLAKAGKEFREDHSQRGKPVPQNKQRAHRFDCALIEFIRSGSPDRFGGPYDSARAAYLEGELIDSHSAFHRSAHIQIAVYNVNCIKGYFWPLEPSLETSSVSPTES